MKLEDQVISLEIARELKELGVEQESLFYWELNSANKYFKGRVVYGNPKDNNDWAIPYSAFSVAELGEFLKQEIYGFPAYAQNARVWFYGNKKENTEANARGKMLIYLMENNLCQV